MSAREILTRLFRDDFVAYKSEAAAQATADAVLAALGEAGVSLIEWHPIETLKFDGRLVFFRMPAGIAIGPSAEPKTRQETVSLIKEYGPSVWPNQKYVPTHWAELPTFTAAPSARPEGEGE